MGIGDIIGIIFVIISIPAIIFFLVGICKLANKPLVITREITFYFKSDDEKKTDDD